MSGKELYMNDYMQEKEMYEIFEKAIEGVLKQK